MMVRRKAKDTSGAPEVEGEVKRAKAKRSREWDQVHNKTVATYRIGEDLKQEIRNLAAELNVSPAAIVQAFLSFTLVEYRKGNKDVYD